MSETGYSEPFRSPRRNPHCPPEGLESLWRRPGDVLGREFSLSLPTSRFHTLPGSLWGALGSISESFRLPKMMIFERVVWSFPRALFAARFGFLRYFFHLVFWVVGPRAQTGQMRKLTHFPCENLFFQGTRQRRARHRKGNRRPKTTPTVDATRPLNMSTPCDFPRSRARL